MRYLVVLILFLTTGASDCMDGEKKKSRRKAVQHTPMLTQLPVEPLKVLPITDLIKAPPYQTKATLALIPALNQQIPLGEFIHKGKVGESVTIASLNLRIAEYELRYVPRYFGEWSGFYAAGGLLGYMTIGPTFTVLAGVGILIYYSTLSDVVHQNQTAHTALTSLQNQLQIAKPLAEMIGNRKLEPMYNATGTELIYSGKTPINAFLELEYKIRLTL